MKMRVLVAFFVTMALAAGTLKAQNNRNAYVPVAEPQYINTFYSLTPNGNLVDLEYQNVVYRPKSWAVPGYASTKVVADIKPGQSVIQLPATAQFVVRGRVNVYPGTIFELHMLKGSKDHREFVMSQAYGSIVGGGVNPESGSVPIRFEPYGTGSYRIIPEQPLAPGEYALMVRGRYSQLFCFGVSGPKKH